MFKGIDLPDGIAPSSANIINAQNEYLIHILQVLKNTKLVNSNNKVGETLTVPSFLKKLP